MDRYFPYEPRRYQADIVLAIRDALSEGKHLVMESGTGTGKTVCVLAGALEVADRTGKRVLYLTRTNSQQEQVVMEFRRIRDRLLSSGDELEDNEDHQVTALQGRNRMCLLTRTDPEARSGNPEELSRYCNERKRSTLKILKGENADTPGCPFFETTCLVGTDEAVQWSRENIPTAEELREKCTGMGTCPYEIVKTMLQESKLVVAPYIYMINPHIFKNLLSWMGCTRESIILVVDEAHNLPDFAREMGSAELGPNTLQLAMEEAKELHDPVVVDGVKLLDFLWTIQDATDELASEYLIEDDALVPPTDLEEALMGRFRLTSLKLEAAFGVLNTYGEIITDIRRKAGRLPRSYIRAVGRFLENWSDLEVSTHIKLVKDQDDPRLEIYCLDPSVVTKEISRTAGSVHLSGTLAPLEEYRDSIGLPKDCPMLRFPSPFPPTNRMVAYCQDTTTQFEALNRDPKNIDRMLERIVECCNMVHPRNTAVYFPSHRLLNTFLEMDMPRRLKGRLHVERRENTQDELMGMLERFRTGTGGILLSVIGGRLSEGMDFPGKCLELVMVAGIPYPKPTAKHRALLHYYDVKFNRGWEYTVTAPTQRKLVQTVGRLIRDPQDRGCALILDKRCVHFTDAFPELEIFLDVKDKVLPFLQRST